MRQPFFSFAILMGIGFNAPLGAQTGGPGQPEFTQFQQAGAEGLVSPSTGGFSQNISLFSIGGYPMNLTYHSGASMEDVSSMVGLGWNLNAGAINRNLRGLPDDFRGDNDKIVRRFNTKNNTTYGGKVAGTAEIAGIGGSGVGLSLEAGMGMFYNNYTGWGLERSLSGGMSASFSLGNSVALSSGVNMGVSSNTQSGVDIYSGSNTSLSVGVGNGNRLGIGMGKTQSVNSLEGSRSSINVNMSLSSPQSNRQNKTMENGKQKDGMGQSSQSIGLSQTSYLNDSYNPDIQFPYNTTSGTFSVSAGGDFYMIDPGIKINGYFTEQKLLYRERAFPAYGSIYETDASLPQDALLDFNREKNLPFFANQSKILPIPFKTPDIFSLQAQGLSMTFSANKSDMGVYGDPYISNYSSGNQAGLELHFGGVFKGGGNYGATSTEISTGRWIPQNIPFRFTALAGTDNGFETAALYNSSEITKDANPIVFSNFAGYKPLSMKATSALGTIDALNLTTVNSRKVNREARQSDIQYLNASEAKQIATVKKIESYTLNSFTDRPTKLISRDTAFRKGNHISEISVKQPDGSRYIFGLPVYNTLQKEVSFAVGGMNATNVNAATGLVAYTPNTDNTINNSRGRDNFYEATETPAYVTSWLITAVLSPDYVDVTGDGPTDDDFGGYVKFNYAQDKAAYGWRTPYEQNQAIFNGLNNAMSSDDKANYVYGTKETWYLHSMESKTERAEFTYAPRQDGLGVLNENGGKNTAATLQSLSNVKIFARSERRELGVNAVPVKQVNFDYDYTLCLGLSNQVNTGKGKLTLKGVSMQYGSSNKGLLSPHQFVYGKMPDNTVVNPSYSRRNVNRWGTYQKDPATVSGTYSDINLTGTISNIDFPYFRHDDSDTLKNAYAWNLTHITSPAGGSIAVEYEPHHYAYVQNKPVMRMMPIIATGVNTSRNLPTTNNNLMESVRVYFKLDQNLPTSTTSFATANKIVREQYVGDIKENYLYYKAIVNLNGSTKERNNGWTRVTGSGVADSSLINGIYHYQYGYIDMATTRINEDLPTPVAANLTTSWRKNAIQFTRINRKDLIFGGTPAGAITQVSDFVNAFGTNWNQLNAETAAAMSYYGTNKTAINQGLCATLDLNKSFIKLYMPAKNKLAGGSRVRRIGINDAWSTMTNSDHPGKDYTIDYNYNTTEKNAEGQDISIPSGVADYEPVTGGDENPLRKPIFYSDIKKQAPDTEYYVEEPINESLFPAPQIIYSKVTQTTNVTTNTAVNKTGRIVNEFYTAKDFPIKVQKTEIAQPRNKSQPTGLNLVLYSSQQERDAVCLTQGFSIELNNMSGMPKATSVYNEKGVRISGDFSEYFEDNDNFTTIDESGKVNRKTRLGVNYEVTLDGKQYYQKNETNCYQVNINGFVWPFLPLPIVGPFLPGYSQATELREFRSFVTNKVIHRNAIIKRKTVYSETAAVMTENLAFDELTGTALLTKTTNEYNDSIFAFNYPAYWNYKNMGASYKNSGVYANNTTAGFTPDDGDLYGDVATGKRYLKTATAWYPVTPPTPANTKLIASRFKNLLGNSMGAVSCIKNPLRAATGTGWATSITFDDNSGVFNASVATFQNMDRTTLCSACGGETSTTTSVAYWEALKRALLQKLWRPAATHTYLTDRVGATVATATSTVTNIRRDGLFTNFVPYWTPGTPWTTAAASIATIGTGWQYREKLNKINTNGSTLETIDVLGRANATKYGYNNLMQIASTSNATDAQNFYTGFEDYYYNRQILPNYPTGTSSESCYIGLGIGLDTYKTYNANPETFIDNSFAHTGHYALRVLQGTKVLFNPLAPACTDPASATCIPCSQGLTANTPTSEPILLSVWVHVPPSKDPMKPRLDDYAGHASVVSALGTLYPIGPIVEGWQRISGYISGDAVFRLIASTSEGFVYFDDLRLHPKNALMVNNVYNSTTFKLSETLDENNYFTRYKYNKEGQLEVIQKETEQGVITVQSAYQSTRKQ